MRLRTLQKHFSPSSEVRSQIMFTLEQINYLHSRLGKMATLLEYVQALKSLGVRKYDSYLFDGHSEYFGNSGEQVDSQAAHEELAIAETSNRESFLEHLRLHEQGQTGYLEMSRGLAESGIEKWTVDVRGKTMTYYNRAGNEMLMEDIE